MSVFIAALAALPATAYSQEEQRQSRGLFDLLFGGPERQVEEPAPPQQERRSPSRRSATVSRRADPPPEPAVDKLENARVVLVVGDFLGGGLAEGLKAAYRESPGVRIVDRTNGSSGFVRDDFYDWNGEITPILEETDPFAVVVMIGSNDRQSLAVDGRSERPRSEAWLEEYVDRVTNLAESIRDENIPVVWTGLPPFKSSSMSSDMLAFNDIYKRVTESVDGDFVDIWDGFVDESGNFVYTGPDMNGQPVRLRAGDGINLTRAARRKIAFYVEKPLNKILGEAISPGIDPLAIANLPGLTFGPGPAGQAVPDHGTPVSLTDPELDGGSGLLGGPVEPGTEEPESPGEQPSVDGFASETRPGRADDFSLRKPPPADEEDAGRPATSAVDNP